MKSVRVCVCVCVREGEGGDVDPRSRTQFLTEYKFCVDEEGDTRTTELKSFLVGLEQPRHMKRKGKLC